MACMDMHNSINGAARISFSNEFVEIRSEKNSTKSSNVNARSSFSKTADDFEFSVTDHAMIPADEIFLKGKILPFKDTSHVHRTLREELLVDEEGPVDGNIFSVRPLFLPSSSFSSKSTWKELLGLKRDHVRSKTTDKLDDKTISGDHNVSLKPEPASRKAIIRDNNRRTVCGTADCLETDTSLHLT